MPEWLAPAAPVAAAALWIGTICPAAAEPPAGAPDPAVTAMRVLTDAAEPLLRLLRLSPPGADSDEVVDWPFGRSALENARAALAQKDPAARRDRLHDALRSTYSLRDEDSPALAELLWKTMADADAIVRRMAADGLETALRKIPPDWRGYASSSLFGLYSYSYWPDPKHLDAAPVIQAADDCDALVRRAAAAALGRSRADLFEWKDNTKNNELFGGGSGSIIDQLKGPSAVVRALLRLMSDRDVPARRAAAAGLRSLLAGLTDLWPNTGWEERRRLRGLVLKAVAPPLSAALADDDRFVRWHAALTLMELNRLEDEGAPVLIDLLTAWYDWQDRPDFRISDTDRIRMVTSLGRIGAVNEDVVPALADTAVSEGAHPELRLAAVEALGRCGPAAARAAPALVELLAAGVAEDDADLRAAAVEALGRIGPGAASALPALRERLKDGRAGVRRLAAEAISRIQSTK